MNIWPKGFKKYCRAAMAAWTTLILAACDGGGSDGAAAAGSCQFIAGGASSVTVTIDPECDGCAVSNAEAAADGNFDTFAEVVVGPVTPILLHDGVSIRATAQPGVVFPGGSWPTVFYREGQGFWELFLFTWVSGTRQTEAELDMTGLDDGTGNGWRSQSASNPFDAVEVNVGSNDNVANISIRIHELCVNACMPGQDGTCSQ